MWKIRTRSPAVLSSAELTASTVHTSLCVERSRSAARGEQREAVVRCSVKFDAGLLQQDVRRRGLLHNIICAQQQRRRDGEAERLGRFEVDGELELRRLLDGQVCGL